MPTPGRAFEQQRLAEREREKGRGAQTLAGDIGGATHRRFERRGGVEAARAACERRRRDRRPRRSRCGMCRGGRSHRRRPRRCLRRGRSCWHQLCRCCFPGTRRRRISPRGCVASGLSRQRPGKPASHCTPPHSADCGALRLSIAGSIRGSLHLIEPHSVRPAAGRNTPPPPTLSDSFRARSCQS